MADSLPDGFLATAPRLPRPVFTRQRWNDLVFVHWPVAAATVAHLFPCGTRPDLFDGATYVGLVPFAMSDVALGLPWSIPYFGRFLETNVRLYSVDDSGRRGVVFRSLESSRLAVVPVTRSILGTPYTWARMRSFREGARLTYESRRRLPQRGMCSRLSVDVGAAVDPTPLETWLTARWGAHTRKAGRTWWVPNEHRPFPLFRAEIVELRDDLVRGAGVTVHGDPLRALYSPGVEARFGRPTVV